MYLGIRVGIADCDFNGHLSNSCFAKNMDAAVMKLGVEFFAGFYLERNCWALPGGSFTMNLLIYFLPNLPRTLSREPFFIHPGDSLVAKVRNTNERCRVG
jgi:hypothetical protein